jgi:hypothetical protein
MATKNKIKNSEAKFILIDRGQNFKKPPHATVCLKLFEVEKYEIMNSVCKGSILVSNRYYGL